MDGLAWLQEDEKEPCVAAFATVCIARPAWRGPCARSQCQTQEVSVEIIPKEGEMKGTHGLLEAPEASNLAPLTLPKDTNPGRRWWYKVGESVVEKAGAPKREFGGAGCPRVSYKEQS